MPIEVRIPTILRTHTGGEKSVQGSGSTLDELFADLDARHTGLRGRVVEEKGEAAALRRFVNVYLNDEDVRFLSGLTTPVKDGDTVVILPAVAGGSRESLLQGLLAGSAAGGSGKSVLLGLLAGCTTGGSGVAGGTASG